MSLKKIVKHSLVVSIFSFAASQGLAQGFLEMPDVTEVPEYEEESMLLDLDVPSVRERDPDPEAGPRLNVKEFRLQGLIEYPSLGITREALIQRVEKIRFELMSEGKLLDSGYTLDEIGEVSDLIAEIEKETAQEHVGALEVQKLVFLIREQRRKRGVTLGMIETVADTITRFYREKGFILAKAYIPQQKVRDGVVTLTLLLGELGDVQIEGGKRISEKMVQSVFKNDLHKPVASWRIEENLYLVNDIPGVSAQGFFTPGGQVGDTKLVVNVLDEAWYSGNFRLDNHGSESTSRNRAYLDLNIHNPLGIGDNLYLAVLNSFSPDTSTYGAVRYSSFVASPRVRAEAGYSTNDFVTGGNLLRDFFITGESTVADGALSYVFRRSRVKNYNVRIAYQDITTSLDAGVGLITGQDLEKVTLSYNFDVLNQKRRQLYAGSVSVSSAQVQSITAFGPQEFDELYVSFDVTMLSFFNFPFTNKETRFVIKSSGQYSGERLSNLSQLSLTGPSKTRGFGINGYQADDGIYLGADWIFGLPKFNDASFFGQPLSRVFQPLVFLDVAYGENQPFEAGEVKAKGELANIGAGLRFNHTSFSGSLLVSTPLMDKVAERKDLTPTSSVYMEVQYAF